MATSKAIKKLWKSPGCADEHESLKAFAKRFASGAFKSSLRELAQGWLKGK